MSPIQIDISDFVNRWSLTIDQTDLLASSILEDVTTSFAKKWSEIAGQELKTSRKEYQESIFINKINDYNYVVGLKGVVPNMIEQGVGDFDMKDGFSSSRKKKSTRNGGWYLTIPFRHATPTAVATSSIFANVMPKQVYKVAKELANKEQISANQLPIQFQIKKVRPTTPQFDMYTHKNPIHEGIQKNQDSTGRSQYISFRRVSSLSDPNAWIHTGITARNLAEKTLNKLDLESIIAKSKVDFYRNVLT